MGCVHSHKKIINPDVDKNDIKIDNQITNTLSQLLFKQQLPNLPLYGEYEAPLHTSIPNLVPRVDNCCFRAIICLKHFIERKISRIVTNKNKINMVDNSISLTSRNGGNAIYDDINGNSTNNQGIDADNPRHSDISTNTCHTLQEAQVSNKMVPRSPRENSCKGSPAPLVPGYYQPLTVEHLSHIYPLEIIPHTFPFDSHSMLKENIDQHNLYNDDIDLKYENHSNPILSNPILSNPNSFTGANIDSIISEIMRDVENTMSDEKYKILVSNLDIIRHIDPNNKLCVDHCGKLSIDTSYLKSITRYLYGNNRTITINHVISTIDTALILRNNGHMDEKLITGLNNLAETYSDSNDVRDKIRKLIINI
jgi:hypothetical protein